MSLSLVPWAIIAVLVVIAGLLAWQWNAAHERIGVLEQQNTQLNQTLKDKQDALDERARIDAQVRDLPPDVVRDGLR